MLIGPSPHHCSPIGRAPLPTQLKCKNEYLVLALGEETAVQEVVGCINWAFRRLKMLRCQEMGARGYALHSVCPQISFSFLYYYFYYSYYYYYYYSTTTTTTTTATATATTTTRLLCYTGHTSWTILLPFF